MFPGIAIIGPLFRQFNAWGLTNNYLALILPNVTFTLPICIWTLTAFFSELPVEVEESARVDGCTRMQAFYKIMVPLAAPGVFTAAILLFIQAWNEFLFARTFMSQPNRLTATVAIAQFEGADIAAQYPVGPDHRRLDRDHPAAGRAGAPLPAPDHLRPDRGRRQGLSGATNIRSMPVNNLTATWQPVQSLESLATHQHDQLLRLHRRDWRRLSGSGPAGGLIRHANLVSMVCIRSGLVDWPGAAVGRHSL